MTESAYMATELRLVGGAMSEDVRPGLLLFLYISLDVWTGTHCQLMRHIFAY